MNNEPKTNSSVHCPSCGNPMESVHLVGGGAGITVLQGDPPDGPIAHLTEIFTGTLTRNEEGCPVLFGAKEKHKFPAKHCRHCKQITIQYRF